MRRPVAARGRTVLLAAAAVAAGVFQAAGVSPADLNLFSGEPAIKPEAPREAENPVLNFLMQKLASHQNPAGTTAPSADAMAHMLVFQDGRQLRGELISLGKDTVVWKRSDASAQLTFARSEIRFIVLTGEPMQVNGMQWQMQAQPQQASNVAAAPSAATVKLPGGDWLYANVTSPDGENFVLSMGGESKFSVPRSAIEWMHFGLAAAPALNLTDDGMALTGWLRAGGSGKPEVKVEDGWISLPQITWIGRAISPPARFEARFDLDPKDGQSTTLWIQPFGPQPNCYGTGTVKLQFSKGELDRCIYINNMNEEKSSMPTDAGANGRASYRVFYDGVDGKITVTRNAKAVGTWPLRDDKEAVKQNAGFQRGINGICLQRDSGMRLARFAVQPWDGVIPKDGEAERTQDSLSVGKEAPVLGKLESISEKELTFSGQKKVPGGGVFLQLHSQPKSTMKSDALLMFGDKGELGAAEVEIQNGRAKFQTSFAGRIEVPEAALQVIRLSPAAAASTPTGALVFKNGDELPGSLISAANGAPLHWKTPDGQEVEFQPGRISGVRFAPGANDKESEGARVELRNGDLLHGLIAKMGKDEVQLKHEQLGVVKVARGQLWTVYPNPKTTVWDAANDPDSWLGVDRKAKEKQTRRTDCVNLNGFFIMRPNGGGLDSTEGTSGIGRDLTGLPDKFELRCEALEPMGQEPNVNLRLSTPANNRGSSTLDLQFYYGNLRVYGWVNNNQNSHSFWKDVALREQPQNGRFQPESRTEIRLFVDNKLGTVDIYSNGVHRAKSGQANNERIPGIGGQVTINGSSGSMAPLVISHVWVGPWNGQLPEPGEAASVALANGDVAESAPVEMRGNNLILDEAGAELEVPVDRVQVIGFGGKPAAAVTAGRVRLASGDSVAVDTFQFSEGKLTAHSPVLGDLHLAGDAMRELVIDAAAAHFPWVAEKKKKQTAATDEKAGPQLLLPGLDPQK